MNLPRKYFVRIAFASLMLVLGPPAVGGPLDERLVVLSDAGSGEASYHLGMLYHMGLAGVPKDPRKAFNLFKLAADRGDPMGAYKYGCYFDGQGEGIVEADPKVALRYKLLAAEAGYALAQEDVAKHLLIDGDTAGGIRWLEAAAAQGSPAALAALGTLYAGLVPAGETAPPVPRDVGKGWAYLLLSARDIPEMKSELEAQLAKQRPEDQKRAKEIISSWKAKPSALSLSNGIADAYKLAGLPVPAN